jgi:hypothetical protein
MPDIIPITELSSEIRKITGQPGPGYRKLHFLACDGVIPAAKSGRQWVVNRKDLGAVIAALGLPAKRSPVAA